MNTNELDEGLALAHDNQGWVEVSERGAWAVFIGFAMLCIGVFLLAI